ncbi:MAG: hypothetical protein K8R45_05540 [Desulfobacterales bacterium]|nr:hypothetical protein [Desulfobacterales bacterium]
MTTKSTDISTRGRAYLFLYVFIVSIFMLRLFSVIYDQLQAPFDLVYESPNLSTIKLIQSGENPYNPNIYSQNPFVITIYTPLYHYVTAGFPILDENPFFFGRIVSMVSMFLSAFVLFFVNKQKSIGMLPVIAIGVFFSFWPVISNTAFLKNDPMALFFSVFAVVLIHNRKSKSSIILSALLCVCALATKQSYISASITCIFYLLLSNRRHFLVLLFFISAFSIIFILITIFKWGDGFWFSTVYALRQDIKYNHAFLLISHMLKQPIACFLVGLSLSSTIIVLKRKPLQALTESPYFIYLFTSSCVLIATIGKQGASTNYFFEFLLSQLMWIVFLFRNIDYSYFKKPVFFFITVAFVLCSSIELQSAERADYSFSNKNIIAIKTAYYQQMNREIDSLGIDEPKILDIFTHIHGYSISDTLYLNDPFLYKILWEKGVLDVKPMVESIRERYFDIIMLPSRIEPEINIKGPYESIINEIVKHYEMGTKGSGYIFCIRSNEKQAL